MIEKYFNFMDLFCFRIFDFLENKGNVFISVQRDSGSPSLLKSNCDILTLCFGDFVGNGAQICVRIKK